MVCIHFPLYSVLMSFVIKLTSYVSPSALVSYCCHKKLQVTISQFSRYSMGQLGTLLKSRKSEIKVLVRLHSFLEALG